MSKVSISACGLCKFSQSDDSVESIMIDAVKALFSDCPEFSKDDVDTFLVSTNDHSKYLGAIISESVGIFPQTAHTVEHLCSSGTNAIVSAYSYIKSDLANAVVVVGADKFDNPGLILDWDLSRSQYTHPKFWASIFTHAYKEKYNITQKDLATIPVKNHKQAQHNPYAQSTETYSIDDVLNSKSITDDLNLLDCSRSCTGSCAVLLLSENLAKSLHQKPVWITGIGQKTHSAGFTKIKDLTKPNSIISAGQSAFTMAKKDPRCVDVAEVHDAFSVFEPLIVENLGLTDYGNGMSYCHTLLDTEDNKINPRGGLLGAGHPLGATGVSQVAEITLQLQGRATSRQVDNPTVGLVHNMSAAATSSTVLVLET